MYLMIIKSQYDKINWGGFYRPRITKINILLNSSLCFWNIYTNPIKTI